MTLEMHDAKRGGGRDWRANGVAPAGGGGLRPISPRRLYANRCNARASTGPRSAAGKARAAQNARRHGLSAAARDPVYDQEVVALAHRIVGDEADGHRLALARRIAEAQVDLMRARRARGEPTSAALITIDVIRRRAAIDRYERQAWSRRRRAIEDFDDAGGGVGHAVPASASDTPSWTGADPVRATEVAAARARTASGPNGQNQANKGFASTANGLQGLRGAGPQSRCSRDERRWRAPNADRLGARLAEDAHDLLTARFRGNGETKPPDKSAAIAKHSVGVLGSLDRRPRASDRESGDDSRKPVISAPLRATLVVAHQRSRGLPVTFRPPDDAWCGPPTMPLDCLAALQTRPSRFGRLTPAGSGRSSSARDCRSAPG